MSSSVASEESDTLRRNEETSSTVIKRKKLKKNEPEESTKKLSQEQIKMVSQLTEFQAQFESFTNLQLKDIQQNFPVGKSREDSAQRQRHLVEIIAREHGALKEFFQHMPGNSLIPKEDQTPLLRAHINTLLLLRWARTYDPSKDAVRILPGRTPYSRGHFRLTGHGQNANDMFDFFKRVDDLKMDAAEHALMRAVVVFTVCPDLTKPEEVRKHYNFLISTFRDVALKKGTQRVWALQSTLNELRTVSGMLMMKRTSSKRSGNSIPLG